MGLAGKRVLVTGSTGFVGKNLTEELKKRGAEVLALVGHDGRLVDVRDWQRISKIKDLDIVYHLAAITNVRFSFENPRETYEVNVLGTLNVLEFCRLHNVEKVVFASSYVYGHPEYLPVDEKHPLNPTSPYASSKVLAEGLCRAYYRDYGLKCVILRPFNIYGQGQSDSFLIPSVLKQLGSKEINLMDPEPRRDFLYIHDAVEAFIKAGEYDKSDFEIFNIGSGVSYSVDQIVRKILSISQQDVRLNYSHERRENEIMNVVADIKKAKGKLAWEPKVGIEDGLTLTILQNHQHREGLE